MFVGHFAVALVAKRVQPRLSLPTLFAAVQLLDILWPLFVLMGIEHSRVTPGITAASPLDLYDIPYSHSLATSVLWSVLFAAPWWLRTKWRDGAIVAACVFSHFVLDWLTHRPDLALLPGNPVRVGLGLWNHLSAALAIEATLFVVGIAIYVRGTRARDKMGSVGMWALFALLTAVWLTGPFAPPPPDIRTVVVSALAAIPIIVGWAWAIDRGRSPRSAPARAIG